MKGPNRNCNDNGNSGGNDNEINDINDKWRERGIYRLLRNSVAD